MACLVEICPKQTFVYLPEKKQCNDIIHRITESPELERIHNNRVQFWAPHRNTQIPNPMSESSDHVFHELWQPGTSAAPHTPCSPNPSPSL